MSDLLKKLSSEDYLRKAWDSLEKRPESYGLDNITIADFKKSLATHLQETSTLLASNRYKYYPLRLYMKDKGGGNYRPIKIPTVRDRVVQRAIADLIGPALNKKYNILNDSSFAYIKDESIRTAAEKLLEWQIKGYRYVCKADIIKFFDRIDKPLLIEKIGAALPKGSDILPLIESALANDIDSSEYAGYKSKTGKAYAPDLIAGIAQGSPLSPLFANVYLADFDCAITKAGIDPGCPLVHAELCTAARNVAAQFHQFGAAELEASTTRTAIARYACQ